MAEINYGNDEKRVINEILSKLGSKSYKIDEYEKLYILSATKSSRGTLITDANFDEKDFDDIKTLDQFVLENILPKADININEQEASNVVNVEQNIDNIANFYMIPKTTYQTVRNGNEELIREVKTYALVDSDGYSLYTVMENGQVVPSNILKEEIRKYMEENYKLALDARHNNSRGYDFIYKSRKNRSSSYFCSFK